MRIEHYFQQIQEAIESCPVLQTFNVSYEKRGTHQGFLRGEIRFVDGSVLHVREFVDTEITIDRLTYVYQYMTDENDLVFRYDNTGHHRGLGLPTYPDHKHVGPDKAVEASDAPPFSTVLREIEPLIQSNY